MHVLGSVCAAVCECVCVLVCERVLVREQRCARVERHGPNRTTVGTTETWRVGFGWRDWSGGSWKKRRHRAFLRHDSGPPPPPHAEFRADNNNNNYIVIVPLTTLSSAYQLKTVRTSYIVHCRNGVIAYGETGLANRYRSICFRLIIIIVSKHGRRNVTLCRWN